MPMPTEREIGKLISSMCQQRALFVLGAGASAPDVPTMAMLRVRIIQRLRKIAPIAQQIRSRSQLHDAVVPDSSTWVENEPLYLQHLVRSGLTTATLQILVNAELTPPEFTEVPPQYRVFDKIPAGAAILNYNTDGLAQRFCGDRHHVAAVHGSVDSDFTRAYALHDLASLKEIVAISQMFDGDEPRGLAPRRQFLYPGPEPAEFLGDPGDSLLGGTLASPSAVVIIGYSFGHTEHGFSDFASFEHFVAVSRGRRRPLILVDPNGADLGGQLAEETENGDLTVVPAYWNRLALALLETMENHGLQTLLMTREHQREVLVRYDSGPVG